MNVTFNLKEIHSLFYDFYKLCHLPLALVDTNYLGILEYPTHKMNYCSLILNFTEGKNRCLFSEQYGYAMAERSEED